MRKKLTILHINCNYMTTKLHQIMMRHFKNLDNIVFAPISMSTASNVIPDENVIVSKCFNKLDRIFYFYKQKKIYESINKNIKNISSFDCIHAYTLFTDGNVAYKLHKKYGIPYIVAIRDTDVNAFYKYRFYLRKRGTNILRNAEKIFFLSKSYENQVMNKYVEKKYKKQILEKVEIIPNGIDDFWLKNINYEKKINTTVKNIKKKKINLIFVGQIIKRKNIKIILRAVEILSKNGWDIIFDVIGKVNDKRLYNKLKKNKFFNYLGEMSKEELIKYYRNHDIFIMPSKTETFGLVYVEAMSQGLPVIYSKNQGFDNQFPNGEVGLRVDNNKAKDSVMSILDIAEDYERYYKNCINNVGKYNWKKICDRYLNIYHDIHNKYEVENEKK